ncbi:MAG: exo-alpha-sialidase [Clostridia bacterium]|jgi:hypothetical protein
MMDEVLKKRLLALGHLLVDQKRARIVVKAQQDKPGFWFGGGNMVDTADGGLLLCGRYRNAGDSTTGLGKGERGLELAIYSSRDGGSTFTKTASWSKQDLSRSQDEVVSIEGVALNRTASGLELFVSTEKRSLSYPAALAQYQKPGTGVWSIDLLTAADVQGLLKAPVEPLLASDQPEHLHVKDPVVHTLPDGGTVLVFCTHPFNWSSSNSAYCIRRAGQQAFEAPVFGFFRRGYTWDVAATRITEVLSIDGALAGVDGSIQLVFYDGAECLRPHDENPAAVKRPRGYSCEEIGGLACTKDNDLDHLERLSVLYPEFISPYGTGTSRYVDTLATAKGIYATWQQAQVDGSQPLVMNFVGWDEVRTTLGTA